MRKSEFRDRDAYAARIAALRPFPKETLMSLRDYYRVVLAYASNALKGNSLAESETKVGVRRWPMRTNCRRIRPSRRAGEFKA